MTIEERIEELFELVSDGVLYDYEGAEKVVELTDKFAIGFVEWIWGNCFNIFNDRFLYKDDEYSTKELLEIYKETL